MPNQDYSGILIYAPVTKNNYIHTVFFELLDRAKFLASKLGGVSISAVLFTSPDRIEGSYDSFKNMGLDKVYYYSDNRLEYYSTEYYSKLIINLVNEIKPEILLIGATNEGRDLAPRVSSGLHTGLTADCIDLDINEKGQLAATRPTFGGQLMATILCKNYPQMATVRSGVFRVNSVADYKETEFINGDISILDTLKNQVEILDFKKEIDNVIDDLDSAEIIVAGGMGLKNEKGFELLKQFADKIGAKVGATRSAVEAGLAKPSIQIGQTGKMVRPKLYIACGISGAIQHVVGMENSEKIIAINTDKEAPIFEISDVGIVGDFFEIIPKYLEEIK